MTSDERVERAAKAIWAERPDCAGKPWPLATPEQKRAYPHNPIAAVDLCFIYAKAALGVSGDGLVAAFPKGTIADTASANSGKPECDDHSICASDAKIERMAKAMYDHIRSPDDLTWEQRRRAGDRTQDSYRAWARAALAAAGPDVPKEVMEAARYEARIAEGREHSMAGIMARWILSSCGEKP
jgi:hypothetical protein